MSTKSPTPSSELTQLSFYRENIPDLERCRNGFEEAELAAYAAQPFMDFALELYDAQVKDESAYFIDGLMDTTGLRALINYAELRAWTAVEQGYVRGLSPDEEVILGIYRAAMPAGGVLCGTQLFDLLDPATGSV